LEITNVKAMHSRVEEIDGQFDYIVSRAVAAMPTFYPLGESKSEEIGTPT